MTKTVIICGNLFDGLSDALLGPIGGSDRG